jgi:nucleotide-binding universal stress UspA family protein
MQSLPPLSAKDQGEQRMTASLDPIGIALAVVFVVSMGALFRWMFKVPPLVPHEVAVVYRSVTGMERLLVPVSGKVASERAVELACRLGAPQKAEIILAYIIEVPFTLSLGSPLPAEESGGESALRTARFIVEQHGLPVRTKMLPHRYAWSGILRIAQEELVDAIVMAAGGSRARPTDGMSRTAQEVMRRAGCEVIISKVPS